MFGQSNATARAAHTCRIRSSANRPSLSTRTATETLSSESRLTAHRRGIGSSSSGSSTTSLASPRTVVVHGATTARRRRGIAASRESTMTGRRPTSANSHHHTSPRAGSGLTWHRPPAATRPGRPTHRVAPPVAPRTRRSSRRSPPIGAGLAAPAVRRPPGRRQWYRYEPSALARGVRCPRSCSDVCEPCHNHATRRFETSCLRTVEIVGHGHGDHRSTAVALGEVHRSARGLHPDDK